MRAESAKAKASASERWGLLPLDVLRGLASFCRRKPLGGLGLVIVAVFLLVVASAPLIAPFEPVTHREAAYSLHSPDRHYLMGGDLLGRDVFSRIVFGARISLIVGLLSVFMGVGAGTLWGIISAYYGGRVDLVGQRLVDTMMSIPGLILALTLVAVLGASIANVVIALGIAIVPTATRLVRGAALTVKENQYIEAARAVGAGDRRILLRHILPNVMAPVLVYATVVFGANIIAEASLSFLGLGVPPPAPSWGGMLSGEVRVYFERAPWLALFPGAALGLVVLSVNLLGDALRDVWDPRLRV